MASSVKEYFFNPLVKWYLVYRLVHLFTFFFFIYHFLLAVMDKPFSVAPWIFFATLALLIAISVIVHQVYLKEQLYAMELFDQLQAKLQEQVNLSNKQTYHITHWEQSSNISVTKAEMPYFYTHLPVHPLLRKAIAKEKREKQSQLVPLRLEIMLHLGEKIEMEGWFEVQQTDSDVPYIELTQVGEEVKAYFGQEWVFPCVCFPTKKE